MVAEKVVIDIIAEDHASQIIESIRRQLSTLTNVSGKISQIFPKPVQNITPDLSKIANAQDKINSLRKNISDTQKGTGKSINIGEVDTSNINRPLQPKFNPQLEQYDDAKAKVEDIQTKGNAPLQPKFNPQLDQYHDAKAKVEDVQKTANTPLQPKFNPPLEKFDGMGKKATETANTVSSTSQNASKSVATLGQTYDMLGEKGTRSATQISKSFSAGRSSFHELNNLLIAVGGQFNNLATQIAGLFGANSLNGMIEKMWKGAAERQTNMLYLIHQKGVEQANSYYNEIMDIVTQLPGDDTFLTNILNMASAMDENIKLDNLKELGTAITDYYIASTMKGELPFETQKDLRKYLTTGETKSLRNSLLANEIDMLKNKNSVLERGQALQEALDKNGFAGMSQYESATNALEEFKGHFQKAFADLGGLVTGVGQPLLKLYNTLDTLFGSRISQGIILVAMVLIGFFTVLGTGMIITSVFFRNFEMLGQALNIFANMTKSVTASQSLLNAVLIEAIGIEDAELVMKNGGILATIRDIKFTYQNIIAKELYTLSTAKETVGIWGLITATGSMIKTKIISIATTIKEIIFGVDKNAVLGAEYALNMQMLPVEISEVRIREAHNILTVNSINLKIKENIAKAKSIVTTVISTVKNIIHSESNLIDAFSEEMNTLAKESNTIATLLNALSKMKKFATTLMLVGITIVETIQTWLSTDATLIEASSHAINAIMKTADAEATFGLATATAFLEATLAPLIIPLLIIVGVIVAIIIVVEKLGEAFGWWKDFGSMIQAIGDGIKRLWDAFVGSDVVQGIIQYFQNFVESVQYVFDCVSDFFKLLFGGGEDDNGTFDIIQSIIDIFGSLGETIKGVWDFIDDMVDNNPFINLLSWLNPLSIIIFHLDEIGSFFEDIGDAIGRFTETEEFVEMQQALGEAWEALQEPFQEIWSLIQEIIDLIGEAFGSGSDPVGRGTEDRINAIVEVFKAVAWVVKNVVAPVIRGLALVIRIVLTPLRLVLSAISFIIKALQGGVDITKAFGDAWAFITKPLSDVFNALKNIGNAIIEVNKNILNSFIGALQWVISQLGVFGKVWEYLSIPISYVWNILKTIGGVINQISNSIKKSFIGKLFGWDKEDNDPNKSPTNRPNVPTSGYSQYLTSSNVNNINNLGRSYNNTSNQRNVVINQNFSEGSMPIDARNMTKKEAKKMFIGAFGYNRSVGSRGILR